MAVDTIVETATWRVKAGHAQMLKGGVIMDVVTAEQAKIAEDAGACARDGAGACAIGHPCGGWRGPMPTLPRSKRS